MARTPVTTEVVEKLKREPVPVLTTETLINAAHEALTDMMAASENGTMDAKPWHEVKPIIDGFRMCARPDCTASFKPRSINPKDTDATEYYCSDDCAIHEFYRKRNLGPVPEKIVSGASQASSRAHREEKKRKRIEAAPEHDAKYGPMRKVIEVIGTTKTSRRVKLECGHTTTSRSDQQRCRHCRPAREEAEGITHLSDDVERRMRQRRAVDSARSNHLAEVKTKRTPVKPPKRGKKGKR